MSPTLVPTGSFSRARARIMGIGVAAALGLALLPATSTAAVPMSASSTSTTKAAPSSTTALQGMAVSDANPSEPLQVTVATDLGSVAIGQQSGLTLAFANNWSGDPSVTFTGLPADVNAALSSVSLTVGDSVGETANVSVTASTDSTGYVYSPSNEHFYEYVEAQDITWTAAEATARTRTFKGQTGYLATIPDAAVNDLISEKIENASNVWFGAAAVHTPDQPIARTWRWAAGPLAGDAVSKCSNYEGVCDFVANEGLYSSWAEGEPNNAGAARWESTDPTCWDAPDGQPPAHCSDWDPATGESAAVTNWGGAVGLWNDLPPGMEEGASGYVVEYGDQPVGATSFTGLVSDTSQVSIVSVPGAPGNVTASRGDGEVVVSFTEAADNGSPVIDYTVTASPDGGTCTTTSTSCTVDGLDNGTTYTFSVVARNANGEGPASETATATPSTTPGAPTTVVAQRGDTTATVTFSAPEQDGGAEVTDYTVTTHPGDATTPCTPSGCVVSGLTNGQEYTFTVTATNVAGSSNPSGPSNPVVPAGVPTKPSDVTATHGNGKAVVSFTASSGNGSPVTGYTVTTQPGGTTTPCQSSPCEVSGLANGTEYTFAVVATNEVGDSDPSDASSAVTPATVPTAPRDLVVTRDDTALQLGFAAPTSDGGSPITGYEYTLDGGEHWLALETSGSSPITATVTGLTNGQAYDLAVRAVNAEGGSPGSEPGQGTPARRPDAPTGVTTTRGDREVTVAFTAPADNGSAITGYTVTSSAGDHTQTCEASPCTVDGLDNGTAYTFSVVATNDVGDSDPSQASDPVTPAAAPGAPRDVTASSHDEAIALAFDAPENDGGAEVTGYEVSLDDGESWQTLTVIDGEPLTASVADLTNGTELQVVVRALNDVGPGEISTPSAEVTPAGRPSAPRDVSGTVFGTSALVSWTAPASDGGMPIVGYTVTAAPGEESCTTEGETSCFVSGLTPGESYVFTVTADNLTEAHHGTGEGPGADSDPVTVNAEPGAPTDLTAEGGDRTLALTWQTPYYHGSSPISGYQVTLDGGHTWRAVTPTHDVAVCRAMRGCGAVVETLVTRVLNGTTYDVAVRAVNDAGAGAATEVVQVTPTVWFADPLTPRQRAGLLPVPRVPEKYRGPARRTTATSAALDGTPAMAAGELDGRRMQPGQAADLGWDPLFEFNRSVLSTAGREQLKSMVPSLRWVDGLTCEGYADYGGADRVARPLSVRRAQVVCRALRDYGADVTVAVRGYGNDVPALVSSRRHPDRAPNRRVVIRITD